MTVSRLGAESIVARHRRWNRDPAIRWAFEMAGEKTPPGSPKKSLSGDGAGSSGKGEVVRVVREFGRTTSWPMLTKTNYTH